MTLLGLLPDTPTGEITKESSSFETKYLVLADTHNDGAITVLETSGVPAIGSTYSFGSEGHLFARCVSKSANRLKPNSKYWVVTVSYETEQGDSDESDEAGDDQEDESPENEHPSISLSFEDIEEPIDWYYDDDELILKPMENSAGYTFSPVPVRKTSLIIWEITRKEVITTNVAALTLNYHNHVNSSNFLGFPPHHVKLAIKASRGFKDLPKDKGRIPYVEIVYTFKIHPDGFDLELLDQGPFWIETVAPRTAHSFKDEEGHPTIGLLDGEGFYLCPAPTARCPGEAEPKFVGPYRIYLEADFNALNLPQSFAQF